MPTSRLLVKTKLLNDQATQDRLRATAAACGIAPDRLTLAGNTPTIDQHLACYAGMDIALDPFPFTGATTTAEALWMGVPVITLPGTTVPSRFSATMLTAAGFPGWIATDADNYVVKAAALAAELQPLSLETRRARRVAQREQMARSEFCNAPAMARALEKAYLEMVHQYAQPPIAN